MVDLRIIRTGEPSRQSTAGGVLPSHAGQHREGPVALEAEAEVAALSTREGPSACKILFWPEVVVVQVKNNSIAIG